MDLFVWSSVLFGGCAKAFVVPFPLYVLNLHVPALARVPGPIHVLRVGSAHMLHFHCRVLNSEGQQEPDPHLRVPVTSPP